MLYLKIAGILNFIAATLHIAVIIGGEKWYRFFGAGEGMARMAKAGMIYPTIITIFIAMILFIWGLYAWSAIGIFYKLPLIKPALFAISAIYIIRGGVVFLLPFFPDAQTSSNFCSSIVVLIYDIIHLLGTIEYIK